MNNLVSVLISAYNAEKYIEECIRAIMLQSYNNIEVIVVNDGSTDNTQEILNRLSHEYARGGGIISITK
ncbi:glycosyltransferase family 2 protein [Histophilus somni]|uniref:glycosyltransferase family 2 protein n=1 Tax=Histophilus somni TaxID=731 RepID=UPI00094AA14B|nr:glycosyltransferase family A protein [Histophilus somni]QEH08532.1 glycosyltransferase family 2 protein [Histophilus somni]QEH12885.1 glycosyltransferase family 2 protein [Histophilus somni]QEH14011.1 glycosyltransferase family 2 protein [Histophilus somni]QEH24802.1 glycosyltransferase family 2 protein [Histophilus somni]QQF65241.1 glycosyltransferase family 2 protein [Histophilus somni]